MSDCGRHGAAIEPVCLHLLPLTVEECRQEGDQFVLSGDYTGGCVVETSADLLHWIAVETAQVTITGQEVSCPPAHNSPSRFYRVRLTP